jgi:hypothetical protein
VCVLLCRIHSYSSCRRLKQSSEATFKLSRDMQWGQHLGEAHASEVHTSGVHTPLKDSTPRHKITTTIQLPTFICDVGPTCSYPHISTALAGITLSGERRRTRKVYLAKITDLKTVHNQWTQTIAICLNTLQRLYNCTRSNRTETSRHWFQALSYG